MNRTAYRAGICWFLYPILTYEGKLGQLEIWHIKLTPKRLPHMLGTSLLRASFLCWTRVENALRSGSLGSGHKPRIYLFPVMIHWWVRKPSRGPNNYVLSHDRSWGRGWVPVKQFKPPSNFLLTVPRRHFCCGSYLFVIIFVVLRIAWLCGHSKTVRIALCIVFCFVQASTVTTSL